MNRIQVPIFELKNLRVTRDGRTALKISQFQFHRGTPYGILGPVGSGKTTLLEILAGRIKPTEGKVLYEKKRFGRTWLGRIKVPPDIVFLEEESGGFTGTVQEYLEKRLPERVDYIRRQYFSRAPLSTEWEMAVPSLSRGHSYRMNMIVAIESDPKVLIIDDYGINFDTQMRRDFDRRLSYSSRKRGTTVVLSSTDMVNVKNVASVVVSLDNGHIAKVRSLKKGQ